MKGPPPELTEVLLVQPPDTEGLRLRTALLSAPKVEVVDELTDACAAVDAAGQFRPDVVVLRVELSDVSDNRVLAALRDIAPRASILLHAFVAHTAVPGRGRWIRRLTDLLVARRDTPALEARLELGGDPASVPLARSLLTQLLGQWEMEDFVDLAELLITELVANAVRHVPGACAVELTRRDEALHIAVIDGGAGVPDLQNPGISAFGGRGLHIVAALASSWGIDHLEDGSKAVWAELRAPLKESE